MHSHINRKKAISLRKKGYSFKEISESLSISKNTASIWLKNVYLNKQAKIRLQERIKFGQNNTRLTKRKKSREVIQKLEVQANRIWSTFKIDQNTAKILCALMYYCEGEKGTGTRVTFTNSDPTLIATFLILFRKAFNLDEKKFRILMHLHTYHNEERQRIFWSRITKISKKQFMKTYQKTNTNKKARKEYNGCISVRYYDALIAKELLVLYNILSHKLILGL